MSEWISEAFGSWFCLAVNALLMCIVVGGTILMILVDRGRVRHPFDPPTEPHERERPAPPELLQACAEAPTSRDRARRMSQLLRHYESIEESADVAVHDPSASAMAQLSAALVRLREFRQDMIARNERGQGVR